MKTNTRYSRNPNSLEEDDFMSSAQIGKFSIRRLSNGNLIIEDEEGDQVECLEEELEMMIEEFFMDRL